MWGCDAETKHCELSPLSETVQHFGMCAVRGRHHVFLREQKSWKVIHSIPFDALRRGLQPLPEEPEAFLPAR